MKMRRGDTKKFKFQRKTKNNEVITIKPEKMYITFKYKDEKEALFQKTFENGIIYNETTNYYHITINPEDTDKLPFTTLKYDVEIINSAGEVKTIKVDELKLLEEVTFKNNEV